MNDMKATQDKVPNGFHSEEEEDWAVDLVCGMQVKRKTAHYHGLYEGKKYFFCGKSCKEHFDNNPAMYAELR